MAVWTISLIFMDLFKVILYDSTMVKHHSTIMCGICVILFGPTIQLQQIPKDPDMS